MKAIKGMELANIFNQSSVLHATNGVSYSSLQQFHIYPSYRGKNFHQRIITYRGLTSRAYPTWRLKQTSPCNGGIIRCKSNHPLWHYDTYKPALYHPGSLSKTSVQCQCQENDSVTFIDGSNSDVDVTEGVGDENSSTNTNFNDDANTAKEGSGDEEADVPTVEELLELLRKALNDLEVARVNSTMFEEKAQKISEAAIALKDEAESALADVNSTLNGIQEIVSEETVAKEAVQKATMSLSLAEARLQVAVDSLKTAKERSVPQEASVDDLSDESGGKEINLFEKGEEALLAAQKDVRECQIHLANCESELKQLQEKKEELQSEVERLNAIAEQAQLNALKAEEDVTNIMLLAEQAVAFELEAAQRVNDAEISLQKAEKSLAASHIDISEGTVSQNGSSYQELLLGDEAVVEEGIEGPTASVGEKGKEIVLEGSRTGSETLLDGQFNTYVQKSEEVTSSDESDSESGLRDIEAEIDKPKSAQMKKQELQWESIKESSPLNAPKALLKKSSRFFSASFFSFAADGEFTPASVFHGFLESARNQFPKLVIASLLLGAGYV